jgi:hypothetical protein
MDTTSLDFDKVYWLSQPPEVRALEVNTTPDQDIRMNRGVELAVKGFKIDVPIMLWGWDPYKVMKLRMDFGYTWVPNALQPRVGAAPGLTGPGIIPYDPFNPPGGSIKVSLNLADYPPVDPPIPLPPSPALDGPVGVQSVGNLYYSVPGETFMDGQKFSDPRGTFLKHVTITPFGRSPYWEKIA